MSREPAGDFEELLNEIKRGQELPVLQGDEAAPISGYERFLEALLKGKHPPYCELVWTGEAYTITVMIHFQRAPVAIKAPGPEAEVYRREAYRRFRRIGAEEQRLVSIRVTIKDCVPVTAEVTMRPGAAELLRVGTSQFMDWGSP